MRDNVIAVPALRRGRGYWGWQLAMDASVSQSTIPVVVDLDGTLILGDLFWESIFQLLRRSP